MGAWEGVIRRYRDWLPELPDSAVVTLREGNTPLLRARSLEKRVGRGVRIFLKCEGFNPTGSFIVPEGNIALGKLAQSIVHGAQVLQIQGLFDKALEIVRRIADEHPVTLVNSVNPFRIEGQKTAAFEICDALGRAPDYHALPVGNAGNITAYWKGYGEYHERGVIERRPKMLGFQAEGAAPLVKGEPIEHPETVATAIKIGNPASWRGAITARDESGGLG